MKTTDELFALLPAEHPNNPKWADYSLGLLKRDYGDGEFYYAEYTADDYMAFYGEEFDGSTPQEALQKLYDHMIKVGDLK